MRQRCMESYHSSMNERKKEREDMMTRRGGDDKTLTSALWSTLNRTLCHRLFFLHLLVLKGLGQGCSCMLPFCRGCPRYACNAECRVWRENKGRENGRTREQERKRVRFRSSHSFISFLPRKEKKMRCNAPCVRLWLWHGCMVDFVGQRSKQEA